MVKQINIDLSERSYPVFFSNDSLSKLVSKINSLHLSKCLIILDKNVIKYHHKLIRRTFSMLDCKIFNYVFIANEKNKNLKQVEKIFSFLSSNYYGKDSAIVAIGGGITGDISGFAASTYMRGIRYFQVPTTLLSMVDSSVGGKTGVNFNYSKNLIGTFYQPDAVYIFPEFLTTLPNRELVSGAGEVFKYSFLADKKNYLLLKNYLIKLFSGKKNNYSSIITSCLSIKSNIVMQDEKEITGLRKILNLGHTFGHALETASNHKLKHGEAVIGGIFCAIFLSEIVGYLDKEKCNMIKNDFSFVKINTSLSNLNPELVYQKMLGDKKNSLGKINFVLIEDVGNIVVNVVVSKASIIEAIERMNKFIKNRKRFKRGKLSGFEGET